jgi:endoglucanase
MLPAKSISFLEKFLKSSSPSGFEEKSAAIFREYIAGFSDNVRTDVTGNTIGVLNEDAPLKVMLAGHYDEIGFQVVYISDEGLLYFREVGGIDKITVPGTDVDIFTEKGPIPGVIGKKPIHLTKPADRSKALEISDLWIDIGAENKKAAEKLVSIGDPVATRPNFQMFGKSRLKSKGLDDKIGAFVVAETLRKLSREKLNVAVFGVGTVQEELGLRGATTSAFGIDPDIGIAVDVGFSTDTPDVEKKLMGDVSLGKGPIISRSADNNPVLVKKLKSTARKRKIPFQETSGYKASGGTDAARIQLTRSGVATAIISVPNRYMHTPVEICDLRDVEWCVNLIADTISSITLNESFIPGID